MTKAKEQAEDLIAAFSWARAYWTRWLAFLVTGPLADPFNARFSRGISDLNFRHVFSANWVYQTPALRGSNALVKGALGSWQISGIWHAQSGIPFGIQGGKGNNSSLSQVGGDRADLVPGQAFNV